MKAIILAAGRGSRMKSLTRRQPKCLTKIRGKSLLQWQLEAIRTAGITEIAIVTGYKRETLLTYGLKEFYNPRWAKTQMVTSLTYASEWLKTESCIVSYSDIFYDTSAIRSLMGNNANIAVTYDPNWLEMWKKRFGNPLLDAETFRLNLDETLAEIGKSPKNLEEVQGQYMGLLRFTPIGWKEIERIRKTLPSGQKDCIHMTEILQIILEQSSLAIATVPYKLDWGEIDSSEDLRLFEKTIDSTDISSIAPKNR